MGEIGSREVIYEVECDRGADPGVLQKIVETSMCDYTIQFKSKHACPTNGSSGSKGWSFVFLVLAGAVLYLAVGIGINKYKFGLEIGSREVIYEVECDRGADPGVLQK